MILKREMLSSSLVKEIQRRISDREIKSGDMLPPQSDIAAEFGVSRTVVREALKQLNIMGLIETKHGIGTYVSSLKPSSLLESLSPLMLMDQSTIDEFFEARMHIESIVAYQAAKKAELKDINDLEKKIFRMKEDLKEGNLEAFSKRDMDFHFFIAKASKNKVLARIIQIIRDLLQQIIGDVYKDGQSANSFLNHNIKIVKAIKERDPENAQKLMKNHILYVERRLKKYRETQ